MMNIQSPSDLTLAAVDPEAVDDKAEPSTLRLLKRSNLFVDDEDLDDDLLDIEAEEADELRFRRRRRRSQAKEQEEAKQEEGRRRRRRRR